MSGDNNFSTALQLHTWGYSVIPSGGGDSGKQPLVEWAAYQTVQPTNEQLSNWNDTLSPSLWGIVTNSTVAVIDADTPEARTELETELGKPHVITPRKGGHFYINTTEQAMPTRTGILPGIDIRGEGGFVNIVGDGYEILTLPHYDTLIPYERIPERILSALNDRKPQIEPGQPIVEGQRNVTLTRMAGAMRGQGFGQHEIETALLMVNSSRCQPPLQDAEVHKIATSIARYPSNISGSNSLLYMSFSELNSYETGQNRDKTRTEAGQNQQVLAKRFDEIVREGGTDWQDKRDIAGQLGVSPTSDTFRKLILRRKDKTIRIHKTRPYLIQWINREYTITQMEGRKPAAFLNIKLPLEMEELIRIPPGAVVGVAGYTSSGKTAWLLETAELNAFSQPMPIYYWYNEMSEEKFLIRCEDFPLLFQAWKVGRFFPVKQDTFEFGDVLVPDAINLIDYIDRDDEFYRIGGDIKQLKERLETGIVIFTQQKAIQKPYGFGGVQSAKATNLYVALDIRYEDAETMYGMAEITKAKEWAGNLNPVHMRCNYHTGGKHGKLFMDGEWGRRKSGG